MDKSYLAGFFDADGYITASRNKESEERKIVCGFTNTNKELLDLMQKYIEKTFKIKSYYGMQKKRKESHKTPFDLRIQGPNVVKLLTQLPIKHSKKVKRLIIAVEIQKCTIRNGKYKEDQLQYRRMLCEKLLNTL